MAISSQSILKKTFIQVPLKSLSLKPAICIAHNQPLSAAITLMSQKGFGCLLVQDSSNRISGIISERDIIKKNLCIDDQNGSKPVSEFMTKDPQTLTNNLSVARALHLMSISGFRHVPVIAPDKSTSIFTSTDLLAYLYENLTSKIEKEEDLHIESNSVDKFFVGDLKTLSLTKAVVASAQDSVESVTKAMLKNSQGACVIINQQKKISGIFTERDFLKKVAAVSQNLLKTQIQELMTPAPESLQNTATVVYALNLMVTKGFRHLPIVDIDEGLLGILSVKNFMSYLSSHIVEELQK